MLLNRIRKNQRRLKSYLSKRQVSCYRLYERDIPEIPLIVDWYEGRLHVCEIERGYEGEERQGRAWVESLVEPLAKALGVSASDISIKTRERQRGTQQYQSEGHLDHREVVHEAGLKFWVNLKDYLDTGLFLDHRHLRQQVGQESANKRVLNLFCYTGAFTVHAAAGGARSSVSMDLSPTYLRWAEDNLRLNEVAALEQHRMMQSDVLVGLKRLATHNEGFDIAVVDPPTFSNSKRSERDFAVQRDHAELLGSTLSLMAPGGRLYFSTNHRRFKLDPNWAQRMVEISDQSVPDDFRNKKIHRAWMMET